MSSARVFDTTDSTGRDWSKELKEFEVTVDPGGLTHQVREHLKEIVRLKTMKTRKVNADSVYKEALHLFQKGEIDYHAKGEGGERRGGAGQAARGDESSPRVGRGSRE
ncbi:hypothetical protein HDU98_012155 [Podochytrium sp. JEL0797]|nr:hypothetical protein HDU98_012155 [Podochytrium sp. JEL0797]